MTPKPVSLTWLHVKTLLRLNADSEGPDQPLNPRSVVKTFTAR